MKSTADKQRSAVFLDRDGTLLKDPGYLADPDGIVFLPDVAESLKRLIERLHLKYLRYLMNQNYLKYLRYRSILRYQLYQKIPNRPSNCRGRIAT